MLEKFVGRKARCAYYSPEKVTGRTRTESICLCERDSSASLAFFEFRGEGSRDATGLCNCGYAEKAHERKQKFAELHLKNVCDNFTPHGPYDYDRYYCGCWGWD